MTPDEADGVWRMMLDIWPQREVTEGQVAVWVIELSRMDRDLVLRALEDLKRTEEWFPSIAKVLETVQVKAHHRRLEQNTATQRRMLSAPTIGREEALAKIRELRARNPLGARAKIDPKWKGIPRLRRSKFVPPPCTETDCAKCGSGPVVDRGGYEKSQVPR